MAADRDRGGDAGAPGGSGADPLALRPLLRSRRARRTDLDRPRVRGRAADLTAGPGRGVPARGRPVGAPPAGPRGRRGHGRRPRRRRTGRGGAPGSRAHRRRSRGGRARLGRGVRRRPGRVQRSAVVRTGLARPRVAGHPRRSDRSDHRHDRDPARPRWTAGPRGDLRAAGSGRRGLRRDQSAGGAGGAGRGGRGSEAPGRSPSPPYAAVSRPPSPRRAPRTRNAAYRSPDRAR